MAAVGAAAPPLEQGSPIPEAAEFAEEADESSNSSPRSSPASPRSACSFRLVYHTPRGTQEPSPDEAPLSRVYQASPPPSARAPLEPPCPSGQPAEPPGVLSAQPLADPHCALPPAGPGGGELPAHGELRPSPARSPERAQCTSPTGVGVVLRHVPGRSIGLRFDPRTLRLRGVDTGTPAAAAGCSKLLGCRIAGVGGVPVRGMGELRRLLAAAPPGPLQLRFIPGWAAAADTEAAAASPPGSPEGGRTWLRVVAPNGVLAREGPHHAYAPVALLPQGSRICVAAEQGGYAKIVAPVQGWCATVTSGGNHVISATRAAVFPPIPKAAETASVPAVRTQLLRRRGSPSGLRDTVHFKKQWPVRPWHCSVPVPTSPLAGKVLAPLRHTALSHASFVEATEDARECIGERVGLLVRGGAFGPAAPVWAQLFDTDRSRAVLDLVARQHPGISGRETDDLLINVWQAGSAWEALALMRMCAERVATAQRFGTGARLRLTPGEIQQGHDFLRSRAMWGQGAVGGNPAVTRQLRLHSEILLPPADKAVSLVTVSGDVAACGAVALLFLLLFIPGVSVNFAIVLAGVDARGLPRSPPGSPMDLRSLRIRMRERIVSSLAGWCGFWCTSAEEALHFLHCIEPLLAAAGRLAPVLCEQHGFDAPWREKLAVLRSKSAAFAPLPDVHPQSGVPSSRRSKAVSLFSGELGGLFGAIVDRVDRADAAAWVASPSHGGHARPGGGGAAGTPQPAALPEPADAPERAAPEAADPGAAAAPPAAAPPAVPPDAPPEAPAEAAPAEAAPPAAAAPSGAAADPADPNPAAASAGASPDEPGRAPAPAAAATPRSEEGGSEGGRAQGQREQLQHEPEGRPGSPQRSGPSQPPSPEPLAGTEQASASPVFTHSSSGSAGLVSPPAAVAQMPSQASCGAGPPTFSFCQQESEDVGEDVLVQAHPRDLPSPSPWPHALGSPSPPLGEAAARPEPPTGVPARPSIMRVTSELVPDPGPRESGAVAPAQQSPDRGQRRGSRAQRRPSAVVSTPPPDAVRPVLGSRRGTRGSRGSLRRLSQSSQAAGGGRRASAARKKLGTMKLELSLAQPAGADAAAGDPVSPRRVPSPRRAQSPLLDSPRSQGHRVSQSLSIDLEGLKAATASRKGSSNRSSRDSLGAQSVRSNVSVLCVAPLALSAALSPTASPSNLKRKSSHRPSRALRAGSTFIGALSPKDGKEGRSRSMFFPGTPGSPGSPGSPGRSRRSRSDFGTEADSPRDSPPQSGRQSADRGRGSQGQLKMKSAVHRVSQIGATQRRLSTAVGRERGNSKQGASSMRRASKMVSSARRASRRISRFGGDEEEFPKDGTEMLTSPVASMQRRRSSVMRRRGSKVNTASARQKGPAQKAEARVKATLKAEDLEWKNFVRYAVGNCGGLFGGARDGGGTMETAIADMTPMQLGTILSRVYADDGWDLKDKLTQVQLVSAVMAFINEVKYIEQCRPREQNGDWYETVRVPDPRPCTECRFEHPSHATPPWARIVFSPIHGAAEATARHWIPGVMYTVDGRRRPAVTVARFDMETLAVIFPDIKKGVTIPRDRLTDVLSELLHLFQKCAVYHDIPQEFALYPPTQQEMEYGARRTPHWLLEKIIGYCSVQALAKLSLADRMVSLAVRRPFQQMMDARYPDRSDGWYEASLRHLISPNVCAAVGENMHLLRKPPLVLTLLAEVTCTLLGFTSSAYWNSFRSVLAKPGWHARFSEYDLKSLTPEMYTTALQIKEGADAGLDRHGRPQAAGARFTLCEATVAQSAPPFVPMYRWVRTLMYYCARHSGRPKQAENYGWVEPHTRYLYWD